MNTLQIKIEKENRKQAWGEHLSDLGFERDQFDDRYNKRIVTWEKDGVTYTAKPSSNNNGDLILNLTEY